MHRKLRPHQRLAYRYCQRQDHPALWMEMRLGKTLVAVRTIARYQLRRPSVGLRVLVIAPNSALGSWENDLRQDGHDGICYLQGTAQRRRALLHYRHPWKLINKEGHRALPEIARLKWDAVVVDESTSIKSPKPLITKFCLRNFRDVPHRWSLTGTPNPESDLDFWCQLAFLDGRAFGCRTYWDFRLRYYNRTPWGYDWQPKIGTMTKVRKEVAERAFVMSRLEAKMDVPKVYETRHVELPKRLLKVYKQLEDDFILEYEGTEVSRTKYAPVKMQWLRQLCGGFINKELKWEGKLAELASILRGELANSQVVVWYNYNHEVYATYDYLKARRVEVEWMTGKVKTKERRRLEGSFRAGGFRVFLIEQEIAQMGADLSAADTAIYYSPPFGGLARTQTEDRILDVIKTGPLLILDLCVKDSVDTDYLEALQARVGGSRWTLKRVHELMMARRAREAA